VVPALDPGDPVVPVVPALDPVVPVGPVVLVVREGPGQVRGLGRGAELTGTDVLGCP
jgi:hypothetical protein